MQTTFSDKAEMNAAENQLVADILKCLYEKEVPALLSHIANDVDVAPKLVNETISRMIDAGMIENDTVNSGLINIGAYKITPKGSETLFQQQGASFAKEHFINAGIEVLRQACHAKEPVQVQIPNLNSKYVASLLEYMEGQGYLKRVVETPGAISVKSADKVKITEKGKSLLEHIGRDPAPESQGPSVKEYPFKFIM